jgi:hypothetical protein
MEKVAHLSDADSTPYIDFLDFRALIRDQEVGSKSANVERGQTTSSCFANIMCY